MKKNSNMTRGRWKRKFGEKEKRNKKSQEKRSERGRDACNEIFMTITVKLCSFTHIVNTYYNKIEKHNFIFPV